ncbi:LysM peptidoglycan-binding domain-containing protein [Photobacterium halotolerans]|uniref:Peptidoglycan-binding protein n=1 Tax=Photobacterium halotolerans TaxID=265726 RepID=A0A0F5V727_9GAMM|nr:LysM domain-containing protein [Photobacterium halotolerans]KKC97887.1 peptidoglycan-binding protein [Photobacterium halotolerans]
MSRSYTVKPNDTLLQIAIDQKVNFNTLLELNPQYQSNPDLIRVGEQVRLPDDSQIEPVEPTYSVVPVSDLRPLEASGPLISPPLCQPSEVHDVVFVTGDGPLEYWILDETASKLLEEETKITDRLLQDYKALIERAPQGEGVTREQLEQHAQAREAWLEDARYAGIFATEDKKPNPATRRAAQVKARRPQPNPNQERVKAMLKSLENRRRFVSQYRDDWFGESSIETLRAEILSQIQKEIDYYKTLEMKAVAPQSTTKAGVAMDKMNKTKKKYTTQHIRKHIVEAYSINQTRHVYIRSRFHEREIRRWKRVPRNSHAMNALEQRDYQGFGRAIRDDIRAEHGNFKVEGKLAEWKADGDKFKEWKATQPYLDEDGDTVFAVSAEAQLFRWGAQASVSTTFEPTKGKIDIGIGGEASFSLAEAKTEASFFLPSENGFPVNLNYRDSNGRDATYSFGCFRFQGKVTLGCFVGVMLDGRAQIGRPEENGASTGVMFTPRVDLDKAPKGDVGFKAQGFAGAQASGQISGGLEWQPPKDENTFNFQVLAEVKLEGNIAAGVGFSADFQLALIGGRFYLKCSGQLVWGIGGGGGFGAMINMEQLWELAKIIWQGLQHVDYRVLENINEDAYGYLVDATLIAFTSDLITDPNQALLRALESGAEQIRRWKEEVDGRNDRQRKANILAKRILNNTTSAGVPFNQLLPEAIGSMLDILVEAFYWSFNEEQEWAIHKLLKESTYSWHKFEEILQRMNPAGKKMSGDQIMFDNLARINAILDGSQQSDFNRWVGKLAEQEKSALVAFEPYTPLSGEALASKKTQVNQQIAQRHQESETQTA